MFHILLATLPPTPPASPLTLADPAAQPLVPAGLTSSNEEVHTVLPLVPSRARVLGCRTQDCLLSDMNVPPGNIIICFSFFVKRRRRISVALGSRRLMAGVSHTVTSPASLVKARAVTQPLAS